MPPPRLTLDSPVADIDTRVANRKAGRTKGPAAHEVLADALGIETVGQLLRHYPRRYIDRSSTASIRAIQTAARTRQPTLTVVGKERDAPIRLGQEVTVIGSVEAVHQRRTRRGQVMVTVVVGDGTGKLDLPYFNQPWMARQLRQGLEVAVSGRVGLYRSRLQLQNQEVEVLRGDEADTVHTGRIIPVHRASDGVTSRTIRELVFRALQHLPAIPEPLPSDVLVGEDLADENTALRRIHFPADQRELRAAIDRLKFDELFTLELGVAYRKRRLERHAVGVEHDLSGPLAEAFVRELPFTMTDAQARATKEVGHDMADRRPMHRLLQGDVGSGKTAVALYAAMVAVQSGHQATIMAPTEVLAAQHFRSTQTLLAALGARDVLDGAGLRASRAKIHDDQASLFSGDAADDPEAGEALLTYALLTGSVTGKDRQRVLEGVRSGNVDLVVGTHALVQEGVEFADLSLAVVDEQHRFGVHQRILLKEKGAAPDVLIMTATPIPRTLALTYYGDLDVSVIDELPAGRRPVETAVARSAEERTAAYRLVRDEVADGRQVFVVCAAIDEKNSIQARAAEKEADRLATQVFPDLRIALLHGRMRPAEKETRMETFRQGDADVLIATTVIEVGVDVPNATVMLVENAERFGLAQLHQLRGRIGRGAFRSYCVLFDEADPDNRDARARLDAMVRTTDGFELADEDLRLRGEGTLFNVQQSGMPDLKLARLADDVALVKRARARAFAVIDDDEELTSHPELLALLRDAFSGEAVEWLFHS
jgi:ATP-dependent DNA helicase RecG